mgnify:CR=1 FL=1
MSTFIWTRRRYRKASSLARYFARHIYDLPGEPPRILQRLFALLEEHPQREDQLLRPLRARLDARRYDDSIPF